MSFDPHDPQLEQIDGTFLGILQHSGKIEEFLNAVFGFLYRRTDYYMVVKPGERFGFPEGGAEKLVLNAFKKYQAIAAEKQKAKRREIEKQLKQDEEALIRKQMAANIREGPVIEEITDDDIPESKPKPKPKPETTVEHNEEVHEDAASGDGTASHEPSSTSRAVSNKSADGRTQANDVYNGADYDAYNWCQTIREADLRVKVPPTCRSAQLLKVEMKKKFIRVAIKDGDQMRTLVEGPLMYEINTEESMWTLVPGEYVHFHLDKYPERWWDGIFENQEKINLDKIEAVRPMDDLDDDAKMVIAGLMEDDKRRKRGMPTREEERIYEMMRKGWNAPGSPYAGRPHPNDVGPQPVSERPGHPD